ncbi:alpha-ribazole phosphatase [Saccharicrinis aurantiacus]|uniref:alpha-ribazole phosphatase n=1 Tax=Saccharicrinis aurantiacus TaxID=1849719 RepID=UPI0008382C23|nr:alpha-ribazole phosphatase [Saccharicrinis aurantiacus]
MKTLYIIRHTTPKVEPGVCYGQADLDITASFQQEANEINQLLKQAEIDTVYSSPLKRCKVLAQELFTDKTIRYNDLLKEIDFGDWELMKWNDIPKEQMETWSADFVHLPPPNGESLGDMNSRANEFLKHCKTSIEDDSTAAIVTHSGIIRCIIAQCLSIPLNKIFRLKLNYASVVKIVLFDSHEEVEILKP